VTVATSPPKYQAAWLGADEVFQMFAQAGIDRKAAAQWLEAVWRDRNCPSIRSQHPDPAHDLFRLDPVAEKSWQMTTLFPLIEIDWDALIQRYGFLVSHAPGVPIPHTVDLPFEVSREQLVKLLPREKAKTGRPWSADWDAIQDVLKAEIEKRGWPDRDNVKGWQTQADAERLVAETVSARNEDAGATTIRGQTRKMLRAIKGEK
jgi:hypothetical protein